MTPGQAWYLDAVVHKATGEESLFLFVVVAPTKVGAVRAGLKAARRKGLVKRHTIYGPLAGPVTAQCSEQILRSNEHVAANGKPIDGYPLQVARTAPPGGRRDDAVPPAHQRQSPRWPGLVLAGVVLSDVALLHARQGPGALALRVRCREATRPRRRVRPIDSDTRETGGVMLHWLRPTFSRSLSREEQLAHKRYYRWWTVKYFPGGTLKLGPLSISWYSYDFCRDLRFERLYIDICVLNRWGWAVWPIRGNVWRSRSS